MTEPVDLYALAAYDYILPKDRIAQTPVEPRDRSRLLVLDRQTGAITPSIFRNIGQFLRPGDLLVANESRVLPARLHGQKADTGAQVELLLIALRPDLGPTTWEVLVKPGRRIRTGHIALFPEGISAEILDTTPAGGRIARLLVDQKVDAAELARRLMRIGEMPLPPYIHTPLRDRERYQTVYARDEGSAAAPTAGLHFTDELIASLADHGISMVYVTLHVGLDTFRPVEEPDLRLHHMHGEAISVSEATVAAITATRAAGGRIVAVGTTSVRTLEALAANGFPLQPYTGRTELFIMPGHTFRLVDAIITNFHLPRSTLLALISAFASRDQILATYQTAIADGYRFYSFGDAMLIL